MAELQNFIALCIIGGLSLGLVVAVVRAAIDN